jgi:hypothetical protein
MPFALPRRGSGLRVKSDGEDALAGGRERWREWLRRERVWGGEMSVGWPVGVGRVR